MRKILLSLTAASAIVAAASVAPASAMTVGTASGIQAAIDGTSVRGGRRLCLPPSLLQQPPRLLVAAGRLRLAVAAGAAAGKTAPKPLIKRRILHRQNPPFLLAERPPDGAHYG